MARLFDIVYAAATFKNILSLQVWDRVWKNADARMAQLEELIPYIQSAGQELVKVGLDRVNDELVPSIEKIRQLTELGFLIAHSSTPFNLHVNDVPTFIVPAGPERDLFAPSPFLVIGREANIADYMIAQLVSYDSIHGELTCNIQSVFGTPGTYSDWVISSGPGVTMAVKQMMDNTLAARDTATGAASTATGAATTAVTKAAQSVQAATDAGTAVSAAAGSATAAATSATLASDKAALVLAGLAGVNLPGPITVGDNGKAIVVAGGVYTLVDIAIQAELDAAVSPKADTSTVNASVAAAANSGRAYAMFLGGS